MQLFSVAKIKKQNPLPVNISFATLYTYLLPLNCNDVLINEFQINLAVKALPRLELQTEGGRVEKVQ